MTHIRRTSLSALGIGLSAVLLTGCGGSQAPPQTEVSPAAAVTLTPEVRACAGVRAVISHLTVDTAHWSPSMQPFDRAVAARIALLSGELDKQAPGAGAQQISVAVHGTSRAFTAVSSAMRSHDRARVTRAIAGSRVAYRRLKAACSLR
jgi:PBP1b-binding outer membrane lipoprotein LpoB